ncbi:DUF6287 domain-containing protein [Lactobacillus sp. ESL0785]|uniref:DUF6287 domain-containing protein n=1 Tax=Lactobacillus sp. ESL0785 TaxID=2983232 RepID=UPI0023F6A6CE|nr:DUF6287 domain-containing protein [Lactobacillus sp. ESL0785]WEV70896.1 DUF6287 domain-containing protein [Lactobacillus sp. ESL0785]
MKKYKLIKLFFCLVTCVEMFSDAYQVRADSSIQSYATKETRKISKKPIMNFSQIKKGNYTSLLGKWKEVGAMHNAYDGKGITWYKLNPKYLFKLKITKHKIREFIQKTRIETFHGKYIFVKNNKKTKLKFYKKNNVLSASADVGAINYAVTFYPKNVPIYDDKYHRKQPKAIDDKKDRIEFWCSNMGSVQVFQRN